MPKSKKTGKHPSKALSAVKVRNLTTQGIAGKYADGNGLYLVVAENGTKKWVWRTTIRGRRRELGVGGDNVPLSEARDTVEELALKMRRGEDILTQRRRERVNIPSFKEAAEALHEHYKPNWKNPKHAAQWINTLKDYAYPVFGDLPVNEIDSSHVLKVLNPIWNDKPETAKRVRQRIGAVLDWAKAKQYREGDNPIALVSPKTRALAKQTGAATHLAALPYTQISAFITEVRAFEDSAEIIRLGLEFTILTAVRSGEVRQARPEEIVGSDWIIPASRMKAKREHRVPLSPRCLEILKRAAELAGPEPEYIFPNPRSGKALSENAFLQLLDQMGKKGKFTVHGFRSSFRDWAAEKTSYPAEVAEAALAHTIRNKVEAAYRRTDHLEQRRKLMEAWAAYCCRAGKVVPFAQQGSK